MIISEHEGIICRISVVAHVAQVANKEGNIVEQQAFAQEDEITVSALDGRTYAFPIADAKLFKMGQAVKFTVETTEGIPT